MRKLFIVATVVAVGAVCVWTVGAQQRPGEPREGREGRTGSGRPPMMQRLAEHFDKQIETDIQWLKDHGLERHAAELEKMRDSNDGEKRAALWQEHRRVQQWMDLLRERPDEGKRAIEGVRLEYEVRDLAVEFRDAEGARRQELGTQLRAKLQKQFDIRLETQRAMIKSIEGRLEKLKASLKEQETLRDKMIDQRFQDLTQPNGPSPEPGPVPGAAEDGRPPRPDRRSEDD